MTLKTHSWLDMKKKGKTICIDFDGVLSDYSSGYQGEDVFGDMIKGADSATQILKEKGWTVIIYTTRPVTDALKKWLEDNKISYDYINENPDQPKDSEGSKLMADIYLDDRGMRFNGDWDWTIRDIASFMPWEKKRKRRNQKAENEAGLRRRSKMDEKEQSVCGRHLKDLVLIK